jgi:tetratricopeptide (TPR) repeat protein
MQMAQQMPSSLELLRAGGPFDENSVLDIESAFVNGFGRLGEMKAGAVSGNFNQSNLQAMLRPGSEASAPYAMPSLPMSGGGRSFGLFGADKALGQALHWRGWDSGRGRQGRQAGYTGWVDQLFPALSAPAEPAEPIESAWPEEALAISRSLLRTDSLRKLDGGLEVRIVRQTRDARWDRITSRTEELELYSPQRWLKRPIHRGTHTLVNWCDADERGAFSLMYKLGRVRESVQNDRDSVTIGLSDHSQRPMHESWPKHNVVVEQSGPGRVTLVTFMDAAPDAQNRITIDTERNVVTKAEAVIDGKLTATFTYSDFVQVAGTWWAQKSVTTDGKGRETAVVTQTIQLVEADAFGERFETELAPRKTVQLVRLPFVTVPDSETAEKDGSASFEHRLSLLLRSAAIQKWDEAIKQLEELEKLAVEGSGIRFVRAAVLQTARRNEDVRQLYLTESDRLERAASQDDYQLSEYLLSNTWDIFDSNERLELLDNLKPVYERQPKHLLAARAWTKHRVQGLRSLNRTEEFLELQRELAASAEWDMAVQTQYAKDLANVGEFEAAYEWLDRAIAVEVERTGGEFDQLFRTHYDLLNSEGRYADLVTLTVRWLETWPSSQDACQRHLGALIYSDRTEDADKTCLEWLTAGQVEGKLDPATKQRLTEAVKYASGQVYGSRYYSYNVEPQWFKPLEETARFFIRHEHHFAIAQQILGANFRDSHEADGLRNWLFEILLEEAATLDQTRLGPIVQWCLTGPTPVATDASWKQIADTLLKRWEGAEDFKVRHSLGDALYPIYGRRLTELSLPFVRTRIERAPDEHKAPLRMFLFNLLLQENWQDEVESEAFALLPLVSTTDNVDHRFATLVEALHRLVDRMLLARQNAARGALQDQEHPEELTRIELAKKHREFLVAAQEGVAERLNVEVKRLRAIERGDEEDGPDPNSALAEWLQIERITLDVQLDRSHEKILAECWAWLGEEPPVVGDDDEADDATEGFPVFDAALRQRAFVTVSYVAALKLSTPDSRKRLLDYVQAGVDRDDDGSPGWKAIKYQLLIALDEPQQLERDLREWIRTDEYATPWRLSLGKLVAEQGEIEEAIGLYEIVERDSQLSPSDYATLSDWYLVADHREEYVKAKIEAFKAWEEYQINNWIQQRLSPWQNSENLPSELDESVLFAFQALFEKSSSPGSYLSQLRQFYQACRDFRLLNMIADSVVGRTPQQVYSFLGSLNSTVLQEVRDEATADEILGRIGELRKELKQPGRDVTPIDLRAFDLLEALVERRASEVLNQPGPHIDAALGALQRAFDHDWADGEPRQMAELLNRLGKLKELADEQLRQFKALHAMEESGTDDRLWIGWYYGNSQYGSYGLRDSGLAIVENAMREYEATHPNGWPSPANTVFRGYVGMLTGTSRHAAAEQFVSHHLENPLNESQKYWLTQRMDDVYLAALGNRGTVSLGSGNTLYQNLLKRLLKATETNNHEHRYATTRKILSFFSTAQYQFLAHKADLRKYAFEQLPPILARQTSHYREIVQQTSNTLHARLGTRTDLEFLITRIENYPKRLQRSQSNPWQHFGHRIAQWRSGLQRVGKLGNLEPRLLKLVLTELRRDLRTRKQRTHYLYYDDYSYFWKEKHAVFARTADEVYAEMKHSRRHVEYIAHYIYRGLASGTKDEVQKHSNRAIEVMLIAHGQQLLELSGQTTLCSWLHERGRYGESIPILEPMVERYPDSMDYRCRLITAYHRMRRLEQRDALLTGTDEHFRQEGRWTESNIARFANTNRDISRYEHAVKLYSELIPLHQRTAPNQGIGNGTLSNYYRNLANSYSSLGQTRAAVDAAAAAVVSWGPRYENRGSALNTLTHVLTAAKDLDEYVTYLDEQLEETGQTSPLIRKTIGTVYLEDREKPTKAIAQLRLALELQLGDMESHTKLIKAYDEAKNPEGAIAAILAQLDRDRHNLVLYKDLANRLASDESLAERAATTIVEAAPREAEHHASLAAHRESQNRWPAAITHWKHAARLRALEPTNLLKLAAAQLKGKQVEAARTTIETISNRTWPSRFNNPVRSELQRLRKILEQTP